MMQNSFAGTTNLLKSSLLKILLAASLFLSFSFSFAQTVILKGKVTDAHTGEPISGAVVFVSYSSMAYTDNNGGFSITGLKEGNTLVKISRIGYRLLTEKINISGDLEKSFSLQPTPIEFGEVIVRTTRFDNYLRNSPYSELMISEDKLEEKPFQSLPDAIKTEPGLSVISEGAWGTEINIRGLSRENVVALIDGNRLATSTDVAARFSLIDLGDVERVEVIKGSSSSIYGSGATGGIVNIITKSPTFNNNFLLRGNLSTGYNSVNSSSMTFGSLYGSGSFWSSKVSASYRKAGNLQTPTGEIKNSKFEDYSFSGNFNLIPVRNQILKLNYQLFKANNAGIPGSSVFPSIADVKYPEEKRELISVGYEIQNITSSFYKLTVKYAHQFIKRDVENIPHVVMNITATETTPARRVSVLRITPEADHKSNNLLLQGNFLFGENNNFVAGLDYWDRSYYGFRQKNQLIEVLNDQGEVVNTTNKTVGEKPLPDSKYRSLGVFAQDEDELIKNKLSVSLGARTDFINVKGEKTLNPVYEIVNGTINYSPTGQQTIWNKIDVNDVAYSSNLGMKYSLYNNLDLTLSLGYSFRSPSLEERFQYIDQGSYVRLGNPDLKSEKGESADLGIRHYAEDFKFVTSLFFNYFSDLVVEKPGTYESKPAFIKTNIGEARLYGFDFRTDFNFYKDFVFYTVLSYVKGDDITANGNLPEIPPLNGNLGFRFSLLELLETDLSLTVFTAQNQVAEGELTTPGYAVFNLAINTKQINISSFNFRIFAGIENILDKNYRNHLSTTRGSITIEPGRNFYFKLLTNF
ncbi:TonB-dependent receptor [bacterium BMS3Abin03]|nr:TonB-dependent receptor [bacterium BMS3Abin03]